MTTDLTDRGLERLICKGLIGDPCDPPSGRTVGQPPPPYGVVGWSPGNHHDYNREYCVDLVQLRTFLHTTQPGGGTPVADGSYETVRSSELTDTATIQSSSHDRDLRGRLPGGRVRGIIWFAAERYVRVRPFSLAAIVFR